MKNRTFSHWLGLVIFLTLLTVYDCFEHINRTNELFAEYPIRWILFSFSSQVILLLIAYLTAMLLQKILPELLASTIGIAIATFAHVTMVGTLLDQLIWFGTLTFPSIWLPPLLFSAIYLVYRMVYSGLTS